MQITRSEADEGAILNRLRLGNAAAVQKRAVPAIEILEGHAVGVDHDPRVLSRDRRMIDVDASGIRDGTLARGLLDV